jgi:para-nitrobenzyl esterase
VPAVTSVNESRSAAILGGMRPIVATRHGRVEGEDRGGLAVFRGIPYARPPLQALRFRRPQPPEPWRGVRSARRFGPSAPQLGAQSRLLATLLGGGPGQDEDCLTLNVWTPACDGRRRPVLVWIHGGAFVMGSGSTALYSGSRLARRGDAVVVTLNYRLGALGFLDLRDALGGDVDANLGLRDQVAALEWVRDHAEGFGGDPGNVTVFGESAGAMSVGTLLGTPSARGLFHRAVLQSGAAHNVSSPEQAARTTETFLRALHAKPLGVAALCAAPVEALLRAQARAAVELALVLGALPFQPCVDGDVLPDFPLRAVAHGASADVPVLLGTNRDEWRLFMLGDPKGRRLDEGGLRRRLRRALPGFSADERPLAELAYETYREAGEPADRWCAFQGDRIFHVPAERLAETRRAAGAAATWRYLFAWAPPLADRRIGACHGLDIPFVFGTLRQPWLRPWLGSTRAARGLSRCMQDAWLAFARTGDPSHEALPAWPTSGSAGETLVFARECRLADAPAAERRAFWARVPGI